MARGGSRPGAGRKPGTPGQRGEKPITRARKAVAEKILSGDITPLEVMIKAMRAADEAGNAREAAFYANMAAPYVHPRLSSVSAQQTVSGQLQVTVISEFPS